MSNALRIAGAACACALLVAGCGGSKKSESGGSTESEGSTTMIAGLSANDHGSKQVSGETEVELDDFYFEPTVLKGKPGAKVKLELKNEGNTTHNFTLDAQNIDQNVDAGEDATVTVTFPKSGQLSFYCSFHKSQGMAGALEATG
jgi:plastocyanin